MIDGKMDSLPHIYIYIYQSQVIITNYKKKKKRCEINGVKKKKNLLTTLLILVNFDWWKDGLTTIYIYIYILFYFPYQITSYHNEL